jgi:hypothetical protein
MEDSFFQHRQRLLTDEAFESAMLSMRNFMSAPGARVMWGMTRVLYANDFRAHVDQMVRDTAVRPMADESSAWKAAIVAELAALRGPRS